ncbi:movement protein [Eragrostis minor streak virus]|uniref:Movement protein n=1 Tax=Eragrostis minor streak virus TaxID=1030595 RepID=F6M061_9GEMI|nr:movement protein [Eragrostis minor streak virus]AEE92740.1 movement protein [Eragrostis minor streak virus]AIY33764.1 movement protein [Eragrostis minor streak virus]AIY33767.1 movement protein [Eragrostis minor streak virus]
MSSLSGPIPISPCPSRSSSSFDGALHALLIAFVGLLLLIGSCWAAFSLFGRELLAIRARQPVRTLSQEEAQLPRPAPSAPLEPVRRDGLRAQAERSPAF